MGGRPSGGPAHPVKYLLDTHALVWWLYSPTLLSGGAKSAISDPANDILVSSISAFEIANKHRLGKWPEIAALALHFSQIVASQRMRILPLGADDAARAGMLPGRHRDPFDRLLAAQAEAEEAPVVTIDAIVATLGVETHW